MRKRFAACMMLAFAGLLAGCYESAHPLIAANMADFPLGNSTRYRLYEWNTELRQWDISEAGTVTRNGDHYDEIDDIAFIPDAKPFLLKSIWDNSYVAQQNSGSAYVYDLVRIESDAIYEYGMPCEEADRKFVGQGLIDSFSTDNGWGNTCTVSSFEKLARVFRAIAAENRQPHGKYVLGTGEAPAQPLPVR